MSKSENPQVFLSYAHNDLKTVRRLYADLKRRSVNVWFDKENIEPGRWKTQIQKAIPKSRYFLFCISNSALQKTVQGSGFIDDELQQAYEIAMAQDERHFTIVPVRLEKELSRGDHRLSIFQQYDLFENWEGGLDKLAVYLGGEAISSVMKRKELTEKDQLIEGLRGKADSAYYADQDEIALPFYEALLALKTDDAKAWHNKGVTLAELGRYEEALTAYEEAIRIEPSYAKAWYNKSISLRSSGKYEEALKAKNEAIRLDPKYTTPRYITGDQR